MTQRSRRRQILRHPRIEAAALLTVLTLAAITALAPAVLAGGTTIVVTTLPGGGWVRSTDNTPGGTAELVAFAEPGTLGNGALALTVAANVDFAGVAQPLPLIPFSSLIGASWRTFVTGEAGVPEEAAALKLPGLLDGLTDFTTLVVEPFRNGTTVTPMVWQTTTLAGGSEVWQTDTADGICIQADPCTFTEFTAAYPSGRFIGVQVAIGTGVPATTSYADGVSLTIDEDGTATTETFDFDVVAAPTAVPTVAPPDPAPATAVPTAVPVSGGLPNTATPSQPDSGLGIALGSLVVLSAVTTAIVWRRRLSR